jgi:RNA polymerase sigma-70 factor, ECF subfamily
MCELAAGAVHHGAVGIGGEFQTILAAAQQGAEWAIAVLYDDLQPRVLRYLRARVGAEAEDVASETWLDVARSIRSFSGDEDDFRGWLFTVAHHRAVDHHRRGSRRPTAATDDSELTSVPGSDDTETAAMDHGALGDEAARRLVASLPAEQAEIVLLRVVAGLSVEEVAAIVGRRPGTVRVLQHRALRRLRKDLEESPEDL